VLDFYNKTYQKVSYVETEVLHVSAEVVDSQGMEHCAVAEIFIPKS
jgi:hypothetical protein